MKFEAGQEKSSYRARLVAVIASGLAVIWMLAGAVLPGAAAPDSAATVVALDCGGGGNTGNSVDIGY